MKNVIDLLINLILLAFYSVITIFIHEFIKAITAYKLGHKYVKLTLNPFRYVEPIGLIFMIIYHYGWGKPTELNTFNNKEKNTITIYTLPIIGNVIFAIIFLILSKFWLSSFFCELAVFNLTFAIFNFIPVYPFCGEKIFRYFASANTIMKYTLFEPVIRVLVFFLLITTNLRSFLDSIVNFLVYLITIIFNI